MKALVAPLYELEEFKAVKSQLGQYTGPVQVSGCIESQMEHFMYSIGDGFNTKVIITFSEQKTKEIYENYKLYDQEVYIYPAKDLMFYNADVHGNYIVKQRLDAIKAIVEGRQAVIITTADGLMNKILPIEAARDNILHFKSGQRLNLEELAKTLRKLGYERAVQVESPGFFAIRGSIIDIFPSTEESPVRIDLWDEEIDSIKYFDVESQRSVENLKEVTVYPASEYILTQEQMEEGIRKVREDAEALEASFRSGMRTEEAHRIKTITEEFCEQALISQGNVALDSYIGYFFQTQVSLLDYLDPKKTICFIDEPDRVQEKARAVMFEFNESMMHRLEKGYVLPGQTDILYSPQETLDRVKRFKCVLFTGLGQAPKDYEVSESRMISAKNINSYQGNFPLLTKELKKYTSQKYRVILLSASRTRAARLAENLREYDLNAFHTEDEERVITGGEIMVMQGNLHKGFEYPDIKLVIITEKDIFGEKKKRKKKKSTYSGEKITNFSELGTGDYVVHENHGLGIYRGIEKIVTDNVTKDYIKIEYANSGILYILASKLDMIQKYADASAERKPKLNRLGSVEWTKTKTRVRGAVREIAKDLVRLYAIRKDREGFQYSPDTVWQKEFEEMFPYSETEDQLNAVEDIKRDMESKKIMDRLICGDVGYGKTEVAIRAAFKAVQDGKQVAILVPTTILALQHYNTITDRMKDYPITVQLLSRFKTATNQKKGIKGLESGMSDIVVGTHRLLSADVKFKNLGLLIIDEEQRFGVVHKEKLKKLKENVDVLTLSATPIPRTLHMSLIGIRDMSVLEEPPVERVPIQTYVMEYDEEIVREVINREVSRKGQVYYVYNRISDIDEVTDKISRLVPGCRVRFAHGQMHERELEGVMYEFINGEVDVLVTTTIIETGLDISNVNTIIIHDSDNFGLSQLYQLRGRVGRSNRTGYAFLMYRRNKVLKEVAEKRLKAIREFTDLGSGIKISLRDLELRGAGNILGSSQHGHMEAVGYDLYCKMLNEAVQEMKGIRTGEEYETTIDLDVDAFIPPRYIKNESQKLDVYKRIAQITSDGEYEDMQDELVDRFGDIPKPVANLLLVALIKAKAHRNYVTEITNTEKWIKFIMFESAKVDVNKIPEIIQKHKKRLTITVEKNPYFTYFLKEPLRDMKEMKTIIWGVLDDIGSIME
ncbi:transcription-repair coupling factor [Parasporobacterium paucivorans]|uniref:Transcription-repair-coupling factor n=1 Tax=Parasporobacterium paucivorans DSM 15970 TaxID=1122934 RepID=A0A1M6CTF1_9FIRM|nr:transcription-repair coupling factor [Parasporobacterium paucivorans]SHI64163.1 transcription-repair coupling factor (superfamily II helicase) [Parasporobacterium paucivorans DSM 15970]